jgi:dicarboxylate/amino acid:cation (Na+ or H+) symporter, DAACS family
MTDRHENGNKYEKEIKTDLDDMTRDKPKGMPLHTKIIIGLLVGAGSGLAVNFILGGENADVKSFVDNFTRPIGQLFLNLLLMIVIPLVFSSLIVGIAGIGDFRKLGRIGLKTFGFAVVFSAISVVIGLTLANVIKPGERVSPDVKEKLIREFGGEGAKRVEDQQKTAEAAKEDTALMSAVKTIVPRNIFNSISSTSPNLLHIVFFAAMIGVAITLLPTQTAAPFMALMESVFAITAKIIDIVMKFAPYAVACLLFNNISVFGLELLQSLGWFMITVLLALGLHMFGTFSLAVAFLSKLNPLEFLRRIKTVVLTAFSTSSSNATLPTTLRVAEENLGVPREINTFVCTVGATVNQNGTALYEGVTVLFLAQLAGADLALSVQLAVVYLAILGGIGAAGVPSGSIPFIIGILVYLDLDPALIAIILGVDRILDMCRTTLNVTGDLCAATFVARTEGYPLYDSKETASAGS